MVDLFKRSTKEGGIEARIADLSARRVRAEPAPPSERPAPANLAPLNNPPVPLRPADDPLTVAREQLIAELRAASASGDSIPPGGDELFKLVEAAVQTYCERQPVAVGPLERRDLVTTIIQELRVLDLLQPAGAESAGEAASARRGSNTAAIEAAKAQIQPLVLEHMDAAAAAQMPRPQFEAQLAHWVKELLAEAKIQLNFIEQRALVDQLVADMLGLGPLEPLLADESINDIMVNGAKQVYVERRGRLELTNVQFRDDQHVMNVITKIVTRVGRRVDESTPLADARLMDGSRVNVIIPPLALDGPSISIRKFSKKTITLDTMAAQANISPAMATVLKIAARCRLNILISGGTGSGKTTLLNAMSRMIDPAERTVTIEDAAELQLQQPHVVRLETRPPNLEGSGEITMRDLVRNALRMRPDRIILGEIRGAEALDVLQAMNTGHDGSMSTIHANSPREALTRLENMVGMTGINLPSRAVRTQIAGAVQLIVQVSRMRDGVRRVVRIMEVVGMEGDVITTQDLFGYQFQGESADGKIRGVFKSSGVRPFFLSRAEYYGLDRALMEVI
jgi:pilus assembly protein CpaF